MTWLGIEPGLVRVVACVLCHSAMAAQGGSWTGRPACLAFPLPVVIKVLIRVYPGAGSVCPQPHRSDSEPSPSMQPCCSTAAHCAYSCHEPGAACSVCACCATNLHARQTDVRLAQLTTAAGRDRTAPAASGSRTLVCRVSLAFQPPTCAWLPPPGSTTIPSSRRRKASRGFLAVSCLTVQSSWSSITQLPPTG